MRLAETQTTINGPYEPTNLTLRQCWEHDLRTDVDNSLLSENMTQEENQVLDALNDICNIGGISGDGGLSALIETIYERAIEQLTAYVEWRVRQAGRYVRDGKWTREQVPTVQMIQTVPWESEGLVEFNGGSEDTAFFIAATEGNDFAVETDRVQGWDHYSAIVKLTPRDGDPALYYLVDRDTLDELVTS